MNNQNHVRQRKEASEINMDSAKYEQRATQSRQHGAKGVRGMKERKSDKGRGSGALSKASTQKWKGIAEVRAEKLVQAV